MSKNGWRTGRSYCWPNSRAFDPDEDLGISVSDGALTVRVRHGEKTTENPRFTTYRYGAVVHAPLPAGARDDAAAEYENGVLTIRVAVPETKTYTRTVSVLRH